MSPFLIAFSIGLQKAGLLQTSASSTIAARRTPEEWKLLLKKE
jgi:hypothetical protein